MGDNWIKLVQPHRVSCTCTEPSASRQYIRPLNAGVYAASCT
jgi:hypothetical protein